MKQITIIITTVLALALTACSHSIANAGVATAEDIIIIPYDEAVEAGRDGARIGQPAAVTDIVTGNNRFMPSTANEPAESYVSNAKVTPSENTGKYSVLSIGMKGRRVDDFFGVPITSFPDRMDPALIHKFYKFSDSVLRVVIDTNDADNAVVAYFITITEEGKVIPFDVPFQKEAVKLGKDSFSAVFDKPDEIISGIAGAGVSYNSYEEYYKKPDVGYTYMSAVLWGYGICDDYGIDLAFKAMGIQSPDSDITFEDIEPYRHDASPNTFGVIKAGYAVSVPFPFDKGENMAYFLNQGNRYTNNEGKDDEARRYAGIAIGMGGEYIDSLFGIPNYSYISGGFKNNIYGSRYSVLRAVFDADNIMVAYFITILNDGHVIPISVPYQEENAYLGKDTFEAFGYGSAGIINPGEGDLLRCYAEKQGLGRPWLFNTYIAADFGFGLNNGADKPNTFGVMQEGLPAIGIIPDIGIIEIVNAIREHRL